MQSDISAKEIVDFWFVAHGEKDWFGGEKEQKAAFDQKIRDRFEKTYEFGLTGALNAWMENREGSLALVLLYDQFPRNMFRDTPKAFMTDPFAKMIAIEAIKKGHDLETEKRERGFYYLPFEHCEDMTDQAKAVDYMRSLGSDHMLDYALRHLELIARFGRFPHRNPILGRQSTPEEMDYLSKPGAGF